MSTLASKHADRAPQRTGEELVWKLERIESLLTKWSSERDSLLHGNNAGESRQWDAAVTMCIDDLSKELGKRK